MNDKQDRLYVCGAPGCSQSFQLEEHLIIHRHKHEMTLKFPSIKADATFTDQTPTPTRFLQNCEEVGLFKEIEEEFLQEQEEEKNKKTLSHNGPPCTNRHHLKPQLQLQHPPQPQPQHPQPLHHPQALGPMMAPSCSLAAQQALSCSSTSSQSGSVITSTLTHSGPVPGPLSCHLHMRNRPRQPLPASLPGSLPDPAMQGASAQHMTIEKQMSCVIGVPAPGHNPSCSSPQRAKQTMSHHYQQQHPGLVNINNPAASMNPMMLPQRLHAPPLQQHPHHHHHHHHHQQQQQPQLPAPPLTYQQRCHAPPPQHRGSSRGHQLLHSGNVPPTHCHQSPPSRLQQSSPPAPPQLSPVAQHMQPSQPPHPQHAVQAGGSCSGGGGNRRRRTTELDPDERRQKFLERNRAAATRCRQKRKLWVSSLEKKAEELTHTNLQLQNEVTSLRSEVGQLKQILLTHKDCPVTARQREAQGYPTAGVSPGGSPTTPADPESHLQAIQHNSISTSSAARGDTLPGV
ncbi:cyclic AMP-responsive element-binding protein 5 isoform X2 [Austrofundulus limnaeus]|uniref:Cyclic AMP-responsive element-binding protein 5-like isoform X2 n=1 Tax=Austrofundulus limnaeus TaxID=52670 RepID=A0A2I4BFZ3_AUSLI|nr:PREDICTED: cyclic AMP-responsive element-binding protein 5-like isoform X2 [Austrofundulus limnaeus]XP_013866658.1 PREDICTED: cyclic AMP-responsive element-binding protein 5-like isoform X2 [Austrofundulus limnaeus]XP_013866659.1 PREDICTED: cyclic AMP-responsive element-binding protein 5-like isoform X2 [Austrofundulus limnaeus]